MGCSIYDALGAEWEGGGAGSSKDIKIGTPKMFKE